MFEPLESRRLMSASLDHGVLTVTGTDQDDAITIEQHHNRIIVSENGHKSRLVADRVSRIVIEAGGGNDVVKAVGLGRAQEPNQAAQTSLTAIAMEIHGGAGNDTLQGGFGNDALWGDDGKDDLRGVEGNDRIHGGRGDDYVLGGIGDDFLQGEWGNDSVFGNRGNDRLHGASGDDHLEDRYGCDSVFGNAGDDLIITHNNDQVMVERPNGTLECVSGDVGSAPDLVSGGGQRRDVAYVNEADISLHTAALREPAPPTPIGEISLREIWERLG